jgi:hypothetical protein
MSGTNLEQVVDKVYAASAVLVEMVHGEKRLWLEEIPRHTVYGVDTISLRCGREDDPFDLRTAIVRWEVCAAIEKAALQLYVDLPPDRKDAYALFYMTVHTMARIVGAAWGHLVGAASGDPEWREMYDPRRAGALAVGALAYVDRLPDE